jgi:hypothetical protein
MREEYRSKLSENRVLMRIFGPKWEEVAGSWRRLNNVELHNLYATSNIIRVVKSRSVKWVGHVVRMEDMKYVYKILVGKHEGKETTRKT